MSPIDDTLPFYFQTLQGKTIVFDASEQAIIAGLTPLEGGEWDDEVEDKSTGKILVKIGSVVLKSERKRVVDDIKAKLIVIQGPYCIYCGLHSDHCGNLQREHIAPKGKKHYPAFVFEPLNLCLACNRCNCELKRDKNVASGDKANYMNNTFSIVHPYFDDITEHLDVGVTNGKCLVKTKNKSTKGAETIRIFELASLAMTNKRSGLLMVQENDPGSKYDELLNKAIQNKYLPKKFTKPTS